nr:hypothetical protein [Tanacetum cinerariifolium]
MDMTMTVCCNGLSSAIHVHLCRDGMGMTMTGCCNGFSSAIYDHLCRQIQGYGCADREVSRKMRRSMAFVCDFQVKGIGSSIIRSCKSSDSLCEIGMYMETKW